MRCHAQAWCALVKLSSCDSFHGGMGAFRVGMPKHASPPLNIFSSIDCHRHNRRTLAFFYLPCLADLSKCNHIADTFVILLFVKFCFVHLFSLSCCMSGLNERIFFIYIYSQTSNRKFQQYHCLLVHKECIHTLR